VSKSGEARCRSSALWLTDWQSIVISNVCLPVAMARSSSDGVAIRYVLPVLWMTWCFICIRKRWKRDNPTTASIPTKFFSATIERRSDMLPLIAFGWGYSIRWCPLTNAFETATHAYRHLANGKNQTGQADIQTNGRTDDRNIALCLSTVGRAIL